MYITLQGVSHEKASVGVVGSENMAHLNATSPSLQRILSVWKMAPNRKRIPLENIPVVVDSSLFAEHAPEIEGALVVPFSSGSPETKLQHPVRVALRRPLGEGNQWKADMAERSNFVTNGVAVFPLVRVRRLS